MLPRRTQARTAKKSVFGLAFLLGIAMAKAGVPKISFVATEYDAGRMLGGQKSSCEFVFTNLGTAPLEITRVTPSCDCTVAASWSVQVQPGGTGTIPVQFEAPDGKGTVEKTVKVYCNDPAQPETVLKIRAALWKRIELIPPYAILRSPIGSTSSVATSVRIVNNLEQPITLSEPKSTNRFFAVELKTVAPGKEFELVVRTMPPLPDRDPQQFIQIDTSVIEEPLISVPTLAINEPGVSVEPTMFVFPSHPLKRATTFSASIRNTGPAPLAVSQAVVTLVNPVAELKEIPLEVIEIEPGRNFRVVVTLPEGFRIPSVRRMPELRIRTSNVRIPELKIPWRVPIDHQQ